MNALFRSFGSFVFASTLITTGFNSPAAQNVSVHYANVQVWVVWNVEGAVLTNCVPALAAVLSNGVPVTISNCLAQTYAIYWSQLPVTNTTTATLVGRLFAQEWAGSILLDDVNASFGV